MITLYTGTPGSGKTLHAVSRIWYNLKRGNAVVSNILLKREEIADRADFYRFFQGASISPADLREFSATYFGGKPCENGILLVLDECQLLFSNRDWRKNSDKGWISFFTQHRKLGFDVILITQYDRMIDKQIRTLVEYESKHRRIDRLPFPWNLIIRLLKGGTFYVRKGWYPLRGEKVDEEIVRVSKKVLRMYDTYDVFDAPALPASASNEAGARDVYSVVRVLSAHSASTRPRNSRRSGGSDRGNGAGLLVDGVRRVSVHDRRKPDSSGLDAGQPTTPD